MFTCRTIQKTSGKLLYWIQIFFSKYRQRYVAYNQFLKFIKAEIFKRIDLSIYNSKISVVRYISFDNPKTLKVISRYLFFAIILNTLQWFSMARKLRKRNVVRKDKRSNQKALIFVHEYFRQRNFVFSVIYTTRRM